MSQLYLPEKEPTHSDYKKIIDSQNSLNSTEQTNLSYEDLTFEKLLKLGNLKYKGRITRHIEDFIEFENKKTEYYEMEDLPVINDKVIVLVEDFLKTLYEKLVNNKIVIPLFSLSYYGGRDGSVDLQVDIDNSNFLINISKYGIIYTFLDKTDPKKIRKGMDNIKSIYQIHFYKSLVNLINEFVA